ncbi:hypothetical protein ACFY19_18090 [Streptosporangium saharense]|uniref:Uncharacterized protein n=1 Tax=Streptosporangium saharense TaxID=1706840 RepID=A0A7W7QVR4_9ACTN|nr:hypothetical protein [Streptosporangium saharense]MBB4920657.1 hypothetical protein [Streptosporangium saharense]
MTGGSELLGHLLHDLLVKGIIVAVALVVLAVGMTIIWRGASRDRDR